MRRFTFLFILLLCYVSLSAQQNNWQHYYELLVDELHDEESEENTNLEDIYETLSELEASPVNINSISREELENMMFLDNEQIEAVVNYVSRYGPVRSKAELLMIPYLDDIRRGLLSCIIYIGEWVEKPRTFLDTLRFEHARSEFDRTFFNNRQRGELTVYGRLPFYERKGDKNGYAGYKYKHWLRFDYRINRRIRVGATASQDAGEPFFANKNKWGYDYYSAYVQLQHMGIIKNMVIGSYKLRTGLGLILNNSFSLGKSFGIVNIQASSTSLRPHSSRYAASYMQGVAATFSLSRNVAATLFGSYRPIDATLDADGENIKTIVRTGYHRTERELRRKHNAHQTTAGISILFNEESFHIGATALFNGYDMNLKPYDAGSSIHQLYRKYYPTGKNFWNASIDYGYKLGKRIRIEGETATGDSRQIATINTLSWKVNNRLTINAVQRYYPYKFTAVTGRSFAEGGTNQNENGAYIGLTWIPNSRFQLMAYTDVAYFKWPKYQVTGSSHSFDNLVQIIYKPLPNYEITSRYRLKMREYNAENNKQLIYKNEHRLRIALNRHYGKWRWKSQIDAAYCRYKEESGGMMLSQMLDYSAKSWEITGGAAYFHTKDYNSRLYLYEPSTAYNLSFPTFFDKGFRLYAMANAIISTNLSLVGKLGFTKYLNRKEIGSAYQLIKSSSQTDLDLMMRWRF